MYLEDLSVGERGLVAVGWLEPEHPFPTGQVERRLAEKLGELLVNPWTCAVSCGFHRCGFCRFNEVPPTLTVNGRSVQMGVSILIVPGKGKLYSTPSLVLHYMDAHHYCPPEEFQDAILNCPQMRSREYFKAVVQCASPEFRASIKGFLTE